MTTLGKILVFLVFVAAVAMGGLMAYTYKFAPNWKEAVEDRDQKINVYKAMADQEAESRRKLIEENEKMKRHLDSKSVESNSFIEQYKLEVKQAKSQADTAKDQKDKANMLAAQAVEESKRLQKEVEFMKTVVEAREKSIVKLQEDITRANNEKQAAENIAQTLTNRNVSLLDQIKAKDVMIAELSKKGQASTAIGGAGTPKDASYQNQPPVMMKGQIEKVDDTDKTLVKINIGTDSGLRKDHTLEVYRLAPKAEYLGRLLIVDADVRHAIGKLLRQPGIAPPTLQPGDEVATKLR
jgi:hypothetical protein